MFYLTMRMPKRQKPLTIDKLFRVLTDRTRLRLLNLMSGQEICVCYLVEVLKTSQPKISRHLAYLRNSGIVSARREGRWMHYRIVPPGAPAVATILKEVQQQFGQDPAMQQDRARLVKACCTRPGLARLRKAPLPASLPRIDSEPAPAALA